MTSPHLLCFGYGYTARALAARLGPDWQVTGTAREPAEGCLRFDRDHPLDPVAITQASHILVSAPPDEAGDPVIAVHRDGLARHSGLCWLGYLSTTGVYGNRDGGWVDETSHLRPSGPRGQRRVAAERAWLDLWERHAVPVHIFRLAGIYGPGRSIFGALRAGRGRRVIKPGQVFSRIHVEDIATVLLASVAQPRPGAIYNVCDDEPAPPDAVVAHAATLLGMTPPEPIPFETADLSPMARSFYDDNRRVSNALIKTELGVRLAYPSYREGLAAILAAEQRRSR